MNRYALHPFGASSVAALAVVAGLAIASPSLAQIVTTPTMDGDALRTALQGNGVTITSIVIKNGVAGQFGTYNGFSTPPVTIRDGVVLSSGNVASMGPLPEVQQPGYEPSSPPAAVNSQMVFEPADATGGTAEFDAYGTASNNIENFQGGFDVAALEVHFTIATANQVKFDFIFGSVEFPFYTSSFTDAFLVFLDGTDPSNQVTFDATGRAVQVGVSFAGLEVTTDVNTAFAAPHGLIHHLTTTTATLSAGEHTIIFEVGDVNDHILDSAAFITNLRTGTGAQGTVESEDLPDCGVADVAGFGATPGMDHQLTVDDLVFYISRFFAGDVAVADIVGFGGHHGADGQVTVDDLVEFIDAFFEGCS